MKDTLISWAHHTANFWWGCNKVSPGCRNCYAKDLAVNRFGKPIWGLTADREYKKGIWKDILKWDKSANERNVRERVFVSSMSDFLEDHEQVDEWRESAKDILSGLTNLDVLILTKRPENAIRFLGDWWNSWPEHIWMGTSVEDQLAANKRISHLLQTPAKIKFLSLEPLLGSVDLTDVDYNNTTVNALTGRVNSTSFEVGFQGDFINWLIIGGESGRNARPMNPRWVAELHQQSIDFGTPFFFKQWGRYMPERIANQYGISYSKTIKHNALVYADLGKNSECRWNGKVIQQLPI